MKFGKYIAGKARPEWEEALIDYKGLKDSIAESAKETVDASDSRAFTPGTTSLGIVGAQTGQDAAEERFFRKLDGEVRKVGVFCKAQVKKIRLDLNALYEKVKSRTPSSDQEQLIAEAHRIGDEYLSLEKYVNLNYMGFHKILKKHDKQLSHAPCMRFYVSHLHQQPWVQGTSSDILVILSNIHSELRGDTSGVKNEDSAQGFVRSTTKYWVRTTDVSSVKHHILQHLPVFQFQSDDPSQGDAQLVNSAYLDNDSTELYHGRLDKKPNAIALRLRWGGRPYMLSKGGCGSVRDSKHRGQVDVTTYGAGIPNAVFVERKTHRESWKGEESVKERVVLQEKKVVPFLDQTYSVEQAKGDLRAKGKNEAEIERFGKFFSEAQKVVDSKQLRPMIRTQYMRTAFQIPFDSTVRVSLDTNLVMIKENPTDGPTCHVAGRWYRDPSLPVPRIDITRFPHAVLEVKLSLHQGEEAPPWIKELLESGYLTEVHKFSKFIHGTATLMPDMVQAVPYWVDDESVRQSMLQSAPVASRGIIDPTNPTSEIAGSSLTIKEGLVAAVLRSVTAIQPRQKQIDAGELSHPLLGDEPTLRLLPDPSDVTGLGPQRKCWRWLSAWSLKRIPAKNSMATTIPMKIEPKTFFANERTFLSWLHMAVTIGGIGAALLGFSGAATVDSKAHLVGVENAPDIIAMILLPVSVLMCGYALMVFLWRGSQIARKQVGYIDDRYGPLCLAGVIVAALSGIFILSLIDFVTQLTVK